MQGMDERLKNLIEEYLNDGNLFALVHSLEVIRTILEHEQFPVEAYNHIFRRYYLNKMRNARKKHAKKTEDTPL